MRPPNPHQNRRSRVSKSKRVILGVTASIAAYKSGDIIRRLRERGWRVSVVMTKDAVRFISPLTLASLSGEKVYRKMFALKEGAWDMSHITLAEEADILLIAPATANIIGKFACGLADDLLTCTVIATKAPVLIAPAMNTQMYQNKIVQENISRLKKVGVGFIAPTKGRLACGTTGDGHLAEAEDIVKAVEQARKK